MEHRVGIILWPFGDNAHKDQVYRIPIKQSLLKYSVDDDVHNCEVPRHSNRYDRVPG
jgi:hypothetical protein